MIFLNSYKNSKVVMIFQFCFDSRLRRFHQEDHETDAAGLSDDRKDRSRTDARERNGPSAKSTE